MKNDLNIGIYLSHKDSGTISTMDKTAEYGYYLVKWASESYTFQYYQKFGKQVMNAGELACDVLYLNPPARFKQ